MEDVSLVPDDVLEAINTLASYNAQAGAMPRNVARVVRVAFHSTKDTTPANPAERFWSLVDVGEPDDCWEWKRPTSVFGYGYFTVNGKRYRAHRYSWESIHGSIPDGLMVCHKCDNRACVNPDHLFLGTAKDNALDMAEKGRSYYKRGEDNNNKLTTDMVREIRDAVGVSQWDLARKYGIGQTAVSSIRRRRTWKWLE